MGYINSSYISFSVSCAILGKVMLPNISCIDFTDRQGIQPFRAPSELSISTTYDPNRRYSPMVFFNWKRVEERKKESLNVYSESFPSCRATDYGPASKTNLCVTSECNSKSLWSKETIRLKQSKLTSRGHRKIENGRMTGSVDEYANLQDLGANSSSDFPVPSFSNQRIDTIDENNAAKDLFIRTYAGYDMENPQGVAKQPLQRAIRGLGSTLNSSAVNSGNSVAKSAITSHLVKSGRASYAVVSSKEADATSSFLTISANNVGNARTGHYKVDILRPSLIESSQSNGSLASGLPSKVDPSELAGVRPDDATEKETSDGESNEIHTREVNPKKERSSHPSELRERLTSIYDKVLVIDNISMAKRVVEKLTNEYRHLIHACDTEACF